MMYKTIMKTEFYKKMFLCAVSLLAGGMCAEAQVAVGTEYLLNLEGTELYLSAETANAGDKSELSLQNVLEAGYEQGISFTTANGGYNVKVGQDFTVVRDQWYMHYENTADVNLTSNDAIFAVEESGEDIKLKNLGSGKYVGCDDRTPGSKVYSDKEGDAVCVFILKDKAAVYKTTLADLITEAQELLDNTEEGTGVGQYPADARQALTDAIAKARTASSNTEATADQLLQAVSELQEAVAAYKAQMVKPVFQTGVYKFYHDASAKGNLLASGYHANSWESWKTEHTALILPAESLGEYNAEFTVQKAPTADGYNILDNNNKPLVNADGNLYVGDNVSLDDDNALFVVEPQDAENHVRIRSVATGKNVGPVDNTKGWSWIHAGTNHTGVDNGDLFRSEFVRVSTGVEQLAADGRYSVKVSNNVLEVNGADSAAIYNMIGWHVADITGNGSTTLQSGIYVVVVKINKIVRTLKLIVK